MLKEQFNVYIDESGDEGFTIKNGRWVSSHWLVVGAFIVRKSNDLTVSRSVNKIKGKFGFPQNRPLHFTNLEHRKRKYVIKTISEGGLFRCTFVAIDKKALVYSSFLRKKGYLYNYAIRHLLERVTWLVDDHDGEANLIFENRSNTSYEDLEAYIRMLEIDDDTQIRKNVIKTFNAVNKAQSKNLQIADAVTSALFQALEIDQYGMHEDSYIRYLTPFIYHRNKNYSSYGLKFLPHPFTSPKFDYDYSWLKKFR